MIIPPRTRSCVGAHHLSRKLKSLGHDARLMPAKYVRPYSKGQKNDFRDIAGKLHTLRIECTRCARKGRVAKLVAQYDLICPDLPKVL